jgi:hypothetical protein
LTFWKSSDPVHAKSWSSYNRLTFSEAKRWLD